MLLEGGFSKAEIEKLCGIESASLSTANADPTRGNLVRRDGMWNLKGNCSMHVYDGEKIKFEKGDIDGWF